MLLGVSDLIIRPRDEDIEVRDQMLIDAKAKCQKIRT